MSNVQTVSVCASTVFQNFSFQMCSSYNNNVRIVAAVSRGPMERSLQFITLIECTCTRANEVVGEGTGSNGRWWAVVIPSVLTLTELGPRGGT